MAEKYLTASKRLFLNYKQNLILDLIQQPFSPSYSTIESLGNKWFRIIPFSKKIEDWLIFKTKIYIRSLDSRNSNYTNPVFLKAFIKEVADYLSLYSQNNPDMVNRKKANEYLNRALYDQSAYIQMLLSRQALKRSVKSSDAKFKNRKRNTKKTNRTNSENDKKAFNNKTYIRVQIVDFCKQKTK